MTVRGSPPRLGRGLAALLGEIATPQPATGQTIRALPIESLEPGPFQPRRAITPEALEDLASSIRSRGILQPLLARPHPTAPDRYQIIAGERRWRAAQLAGMHEAPTLIRAMTDADAMAAALVENLQRQDLNPIEEAEGYQRLVQEFDMSHETLAAMVGKSRSHVSNTLRLLNLPDPVQGEVRSGALSAGHARALLSHPDPQRMALAVIAHGLNVRQTEALAARAVAGESGNTSADRVPDLHSRALERSLSAKLGLHVKITSNGRSGSIRMDYTSLDQLDSLLALLDPR